MPAPYKNRKSNHGEAEKPSVKELCDRLIRDAVKIGASDIHLEPFEAFVRVRLRIDGRLKVTEELSIALYPEIISRIKIMAEMNIAERRLPQDGKISMKLEGNSYDFRVSTAPTVYGEKAVIRIYNRALAVGELCALGFTEAQEREALRLIHRPHGMLLLTGPTGSGKSTTLYRFLRELNRTDVNIMAVEDPIENEIPGINQVQVNPKAGLTFAAALRSFLRQDPNIIMIGEIRDEETAQIATRAAITGRLVLSTIHTNDAAGVITRLCNMGIPSYLVADSLIGAIAQRLLRRLCPHCKRPLKLNAATAKRLGVEEGTVIQTPIGCERCDHSGYLGRIGVFEILTLNEEMRKMILAPDLTSDRIENLLKERQATLCDHAKARVLSGETSLEEYEQLLME